MAWKQAVLGIGLAIGLVTTAGAEIPGGTIRIGVLNDMSGGMAAANGPGSVVAAQMAAEDFAGGGRGLKVEILAGDHQNKPDVGLSIVRKWLDVDHVDAVADGQNSAVVLAVNALMRGRRQVFIASTAGTTEVTGKSCSPNTFVWTLDSWSLANAVVRPLLQTGAKSWFFLTVDFALGQSLEHDATALVQAQGGQVLGHAVHPLGAGDFASYILAAQSSGAQVVALANVGTDTLNAIKQMHEFGAVGNGTSLATLLLFVTDVHALGLEAAQGLLLAEAFYWDLNPQTRDWSRRFAARHDGQMPTSTQAGVYSSVLAYLKAAAVVDSTDAAAVMAELKRAPIDDPLFGRATIRADGRTIHPMYLFQVKRPAESSGPWDDYRLVDTIPAESAFRPLAAGGCPLAAGGE